MTDRHKTQGRLIRFPDDVDDKLVQAAQAHDLAVNWLVNKAVREFLERLLPPEEVKWTR